MATLDLYREGSTQSWLPSDVSIGVMTTMLSCHLHDKRVNGPSQTKQSLDWIGLDDVADKNVLVRGGKWIGKTTIDRGVLHPAIRCQYV